MRQAHLRVLDRIEQLVDVEFPGAPADPVRAVVECLVGDEQHGGSARADLAQQLFQTLADVVAARHIAVQALDGHAAIGEGTGVIVFFVDHFLGGQGDADALLQCRGQFNRLPDDGGGLAAARDGVNHSDAHVVFPPVVDGGVSAWPDRCACRQPSAGGAVRHVAGDTWRHCSGFVRVCVPCDPAVFDSHPSCLLMPGRSKPGENRRENRRFLAEKYGAVWYSLIESVE